MTEKESLSDERTDNELAQLISDGVSRDLRRYPCRFDTENE